GENLVGESVEWQGATPFGPNAWRVTAHTLGQNRKSASKCFSGAAAIQRSAAAERRRGQAHSFFAAGKSPTQIDAVEPFLDRPMGFDKAHMGVNRQILRHRRVGVEPYRRQATAPGLADGMIHEQAP